MKKTYSQFRQDIWVVRLFRGKRNGFFMELGAGDGIALSNTLLLEKKFCWTGILIEPSSNFEKLKINRPGCILDNSCIASEKKKINLFEIYDCGQEEGNLFFSTVRDDLGMGDGEKIAPCNGIFRKAYQKDAVPLQEILYKYKVKKIIDYFSLDVEGYEYEVLRNFPFKEFTFLCLGVESPSGKLQGLLLDNGYMFIAKRGPDFMYVHITIGKFLLWRILFFEAALRFFLKRFNIFRVMFRNAKKHWITTPS